jgi:hypothetical protein
MKEITFITWWECQDWLSTTRIFFTKCSLHHHWCITCVLFDPTSIPNFSFSNTIRFVINFNFSWIVDKSTLNRDEPSNVGVLGDGPASCLRPKIILSSLIIQCLYSSSSTTRRNGTDANRSRIQIPSISSD